MDWRGHYFGAVEEDEHGHVRVKQSPKALLLLLVALLLFFWISGKVFGQPPDGSILFHEALERRQYDQVIDMLRLGSDPNELSSSGILPLVAAARDESADAYDVVLELLRWGAKPNLHGDDGITALYMAAMSGNLGVVDLLIRHGADVDGAENGADPPVHVAYAQGNFRVARFLESFGATAPQGEELEMLEYAGRMKNKVDAFLERPKPERFSEEEWLRQGVTKALVEEEPWIAAPGMETLLETVDEIYLVPRPEGMNDEQWYYMTRALLEKRLASGEFQSQIEKIQEFQLDQQGDTN